MASVQPYFIPAPDMVNTARWIVVVMKRASGIISVNACFLSAVSWSPERFHHGDKQWSVLFQSTDFLAVDW
ncbi:MAG: hypothetical protein KDA54_07870 [Phycisphaerales bacterium]|nr:hypothetical protein [Phycisphaerales bacterium]